MIRPENELRSGPEWAHLLGYLITLCVAFAVSRIVGVFVLFLIIGGNGRKWFRRNTPFLAFSARAGAVICGVIWGLILGGVYFAAVRLLHPTKAMSIALLVWGVMAAGYSVYDVPSNPLFWDRSHTNLIVIQLCSILLFLVISLGTIYATRW